MVMVHFTLAEIKTVNEHYTLKWLKVLTTYVYYIILNL